MFFQGPHVQTPRTCSAFNATKVSKLTTLVFGESDCDYASGKPIDGLRGVCTQLALTCPWSVSVTICPLSVFDTHDGVHLAPATQYPPLQTVFRQGRGGGSVNDIYARLHLLFQADADVHEAEHSLQVADVLNKEFRGQ
jgi:hypothetical protein